MNQFVDFLEGFCGSLSQASRKEILGSACAKTYKRKEYIQREGLHDGCFYYVESGLLKQCYDINNRQYIIDFLEKDSTIMNFGNSSGYSSRSNFSIIAIEDSKVISLDYRKMGELANKSHQLERYLRRNYEYSIIKAIEWNRKMLGFKAEEVYLRFLTDHPHIVQRISLGEMSSYLGINQASLSRIRSKLFEKHNSKSRI